MGEYLLFIFSVCAVCALCAMMAYKRGSAEKLALGVLMLYAVTMPAIELVDGWSADVLPLLPEVSESESEELVALAREAFEEGIRMHICERLSLEEDCVSVRAVDFDLSQMRARSVNVLLSGRGALCDYRSLEKYLDGLGLGECRVEIEI